MCVSTKGAQTNFKILLWNLEILLFKCQTGNFVKRAQKKFLFSKFVCLFLLKCLFDKLNHLLVVKFWILPSLFYEMSAPEAQ